MEAFESLTSNDQRSKFYQWINTNCDAVIQLDDGGDHNDRDNDNSNTTSSAKANISRGSTIPETSYVKDDSGTVLPGNTTSSPTMPPCTRPSTEAAGAMSTVAPKIDITCGSATDTEANGQVRGNGQRSPLFRFRSQNQNSNDNNNSNMNSNSAAISGGEEVEGGGEDVEARDSAGSERAESGSGASFAMDQSP